MLMNETQMNDRLRNLLENYRNQLLWAGSIKELIQAKIEEREELYVDIQSANGCRNETRGSGVTSNKTETAVIRIEALSNEIAELDAECQTCLSERQKLRNAVNKLIPEHRDIVKLYYFGAKITWQDLAKKMLISERSLRRKHDLALVTLEKLPDLSGNAG